MKKKWMAAGLALTMLLLSGCTQKAAEPLEAPELLEPVNVKVDSEEVHFGSVSQIDVYEGEIVPYVEELEFQISGKVLEMAVSLGDWVEEGDVLMRLDQRNEQEQVEELEKSIEYTRKMNEFENRKKELDIEMARLNLESITAQGAQRQTVELARQSLKEAETALRQQKEMQEQNLKQSRLQLQALLEKMGQDELIAPVSGYVLFSQNLKKGSWVKEMETVMCIADPSRLFVRAEGYVATSSYQDGVCTVWADGRAVEIIQRPVETDDYLRHVLLDEELFSEYDFAPGADLSGIEAGMYAVILYEYNRAEDTLWVPANALMSDTDSSYVYVLNEDGQQIRRNVKIGKLNSRQAQILEGLEEGERVCVRN